MKFITIGLRRSGTTIFWDTFRQDKSLKSFNEPFHTHLHHMTFERNHPAYTEYIELFEKGELQDFPPIFPKEEINPKHTTAQLDAFKKLLLPYKKYNVDLVRNIFKADEIAKVYPDTLILLIFRNPVAWVSSHLLPTGKKTLSFKINKILRESTFWTNKKNYDFYSYETIIDQEDLKLIRNYLQRKKIDAKAEDLYAYEKMLILWQTAFESAVSAANENKNVRLVHFEDFLDSPQSFHQDFYQYFGKEVFKFDYSSFRKANNGFQPENVKWKVAMKRLKIKSND